MKLLIRAPNWIGDSILAVPAIESIPHRYPDVEIWISGRPWIKDLFLSYPFIEGIIPLPDRLDLKSLRGSSRELKRYGFDTGLLLTNSFASALLFALAGIPERWGYATDGRGFLLTRRIPPAPASAATVHQVEYYRTLISALGFNPVPPSLSFALEPEEMQWADDYLQTLGAAPSKPLVVIHPGGHYGRAKRWSPDRFQALAALLQERKQAQIVIVGSADDMPTAKVVAGSMKPAPINLTGRTSLRQLAAVLSRADLCVCNDSGPMHVANALRIPVVALFGPTDPCATAPFQEPSTYIRNPVACWPCSYRDCPFDHRCMTSISVEDVYASCMAWLS
jgi:heptosyltransferase-2